MSQSTQLNEFRYCDLNNSFFFKKKKKKRKRFQANKRKKQKVPRTNNNRRDYTDDIALQANAPAHAETLSYGSQT